MDIEKVKHMIKPTKLLCKTKCFYCPPVGMKSESQNKSIDCDKR